MNLSQSLVCQLVTFITVQVMPSVEQAICYWRISEKYFGQMLGWSFAEPLLIPLTDPDNALMMLRKAWFIPKTDPESAVIGTMNCSLVPPPPARGGTHPPSHWSETTLTGIKFPLSPVEHLRPRRSYLSSKDGDIAIESWPRKRVLRHNEFGRLC